MTPSDRDEWDLMDKIGRRNAEQRANRLAELAEAKAAAVGKEPFDLTKLEMLCDTSTEGRLDAVDVRRERFEYMYYVDYPALLTLEDFARKVEELNKW